MTARRLAGLGAALIALGCASKSERPPPPTCLGNCGLSPGLGSGLPSDQGGGGSQGEGGSSGTSSKGVELTGKVLILNDDLDPSTGALLTDSVDLKSEGATGKTVTGFWDGSDDFSIKGVRVATPVWVLATPRNAVADDALPAVEPVRTDSPDAAGQVEVNLALVHSSTIEHVFDLATVPITPDPGKAQVVLLLVKKDTSVAEPPPLPGVKVTASSAEDVFYGASAAFSDVATETDATGAVVLANVPAAVWPGAEISVEFSGAKSGGAQVRAVNGAVTVATLPL